MSKQQQLEFTRRDLVSSFKYIYRQAWSSEIIDMIEDIWWWRGRQYLRSWHGGGADQPGGQADQVRGQEARPERGLYLGGSD